MMYILAKLTSLCAPKFASILSFRYINIVYKIDRIKSREIYKAKLRVMNRPFMILEGDCFCILNTIYVFKETVFTFLLISTYSIRTAAGLNED